MKSLEAESNQLKEIIAELKSAKQEVNSNVDAEFELTKRDLQTVVEELTALKVEKEKN